MNVKIEVGKPVRMDADTTGPAYNVYPVTVSGEGKGITRTTLSINESGVSESAVGRLIFKVSERDYPAGNHDLFASVTDGNETATATSSLSMSKAAAEAPRAAAPSSPGSTAPQK